MNKAPKRICNNCKWAIGCKVQGVEPPKPMKSHFWSFLLEDFKVRYAHAIWMDDKYAHENMITCIRYPLTKGKRKIDTCGEHSPPKKEAQ